MGSTLREGTLVLSDDVPVRRALDLLREPDRRSVPIVDARHVMVGLLHEACFITSRVQLGADRAMSTGQTEGSDSDSGMSRCSVKERWTCRMPHGRAICPTPRDCDPLRARASSSEAQKPARLTGTRAAEPPSPMMTKRTVFLAGLFSVSLCSLVACAGDPARQADDAHDKDLKAERKEQQSTADDRADTRVKAAEAQRNDTDAVATGSGTAADAKMTEARDIARAKATERLEKLDAKTSELRQRVDKAGAKAPTASRDALKTVDTQRSLVTTALDQFPRVSNDDFKQAKTSLDTQLDILDGLVKKADTEVGKIKK